MATLVGAVTPLNFGVVDVGTKIFRRVDVTLKGEDAALVSHVGIAITAVAGSGTFFPAEVWVQTLSGAVAVPLQQLAPGGTVTISDKATDPNTVLRFYFAWSPATAVDDASAADLELTQDISPSINIPAVGTARIRKNLNLVMVLDTSGSMNDPGAGTDSKITTLNKAINAAEALLRPTDQLGVVSFNTTASTLRALSAPSTIAPLTAAGWTAIGEGILLGRSMLPAAGSTFRNALLLITDGMENRGANVIIFPNPDDPDGPQVQVLPQGATTQERTFAIGVGSGANINQTALTNFAGASGGYLHVTGDLNAATQSIWQLQKFVLQMVADASQMETLIDPEGRLNPGQTAVIPFAVTEADSTMDAIVLNDDPDNLLYFLISPDGHAIYPGTVSPAVQYVSTPYVTFFRIQLNQLPAAFGKTYGTWRAVLRSREKGDAYLVGKPTTKKDDPFLKAGGGSFVAASSKPLNYSFLVHADTDVKLRVALKQKGHEPGDEVVLHASLVGDAMKKTEVDVEITSPDGTVDTLKLKHLYGSQYSGSFIGAFVGTYSARFRATGQTLIGTPFHREATRSASIYTGNGWDTGRDNPGGKPGTGGGGKDDGCKCCCHEHHCHEHHCHGHHGCKHRHGDC